MFDPVAVLAGCNGLGTAVEGMVVFGPVTLDLAKASEYAAGVDFAPFLVEHRAASPGGEDGAKPEHKAAIQLAWHCGCRHPSPFPFPALRRLFGFAATPFARRTAHTGWLLISQPAAIVVRPTAHPHPSQSYYE